MTSTPKFHNMANATYIFLISLSIIFLGFLIKKINILSEDNGKIIVKLIFNITLPALILNTLSSIKLDLSFILLPIIPLLFSFGVLLFCFLIFKNYNKETKSLILITVIGFNIGNFAYPLIEGIWGEEGLQYLVLFDVGNAFVIFGIISFLASYYSKTNENDINKINLKNHILRLFKSPPMIAVIGALIINLSGLIIPIFLIDFLNILSRANMALTLLSLGIYLNFKFEKSEWKNIAKIFIIRYCFGFIIGFVLFLILPFSLLYRTIVFISLILPMAMGTLLFAVEFEHNERIAGIVGNITLIISFIFMWILVLIINA
ncbi:MAG: AEC family transporter [Promethearchaeota archaeon]